MCNGTNKHWITVIVPWAQAAQLPGGAIIKQSGTIDVSIPESAKSFPGADGILGIAPPGFDRGF
jgi:hypothetical protein